MNGLVCSVWQDVATTLDVKLPKTLPKDEIYKSNGVLFAGGILIKSFCKELLLLKLPPGVQSV